MTPLDYSDFQPKNDDLEIFDYSDLGLDERGGVGGGARGGRGGGGGEVATNPGRGGRQGRNQVGGDSTTAGANATSVRSWSKTHDYIQVEYQCLESK